MSVVTKTFYRLTGTLQKFAFNPVLTGAILFTLTNGPATLRERLINSFAALRDPRRFATIVRALKVLLALGVIARVNGYANRVALNAWRVKSEKKRWQWNKEVAVVTGGCSGIGELVVKGLANKGVKVAVLDIQQLPPSLQGWANIKFFACNVTDPKAVNSAAEEIRSTLGPATILVNNAGIAAAHTILETSEEWLRKQFDVNVLSNWFTTQAFLPDMIKSNKGHIITVASLASFLGLGGMVDYCSTKAGVLAFHEGLTQELKHRYNAPNVMTTIIHPNWVRTPLVEAYVKELQKRGIRLLEPKSVSDAIVKQIVSCSAGQVILPSAANRAPAMRGWPNWLQEVFRDGVSKALIPEK